MRITRANEAVLGRTRLDSSIHNHLWGNSKRIATPRSRVMTSDEVRQFGKALRAYKGRLKENILFLLLAGVRPGVVINWDPAWVQGDLLVLPGNIPGLKKKQIILLSPLTRDLIPRLVPCTRAHLRHTLNNILAKAEILNLKLSDLRRTYLCAGLDIGVPTDIVIALVHNRPSGFRASHVRRDPAALMPYVIQISEHLLRLLDGDAGDQDLRDLQEVMR